ncbi:MAG TPA: MBL fold metallo-hydrolase, partial [candidate division Zixibacteria bacterium]|nr:MBL fold metallo-hydrolase [candidate division Zixibacteria bacterium]
MRATTSIKLSILIILSITRLLPAQDFDNVQINPVKVTDNIYMLEGQGGNIGLFFGPQGTFVIDDQYAPLHEKIVAKIKELTTGSVPENGNVFVINTHYHVDHTSGNELMGKTGAIIVAHENVRKRLSTEQVNKLFNRTFPPSPAGALPIITFTDDLTFHINGDSVKVHHVAPAHTDGDAIIIFTKANVIHTGDLLFTSSYPIIDLDGGGSVMGMIRAIGEVMKLCNEQTKVIPGHGKLTDKAGLAKFREMLDTIFMRVSN